MPVFAGISLLYYNTLIELPAQSVVIDAPVSISGNLDTKFSGSGLLACATAGMAVSRDFFTIFRITPYYLYIVSFNNPDLINKTRIASTGFLNDSASIDSEIEGERVSAGMFGLCLTLLSSRRFSISASLGGFLTSSSGYYNKKFLNGLEMKSAVVILTYKSNFSSTE